jgi:hypothetical protein
MTTTDCFTFTTADRKLTGTCAILVAALSLVAIPLYFLYSGPPPANNVLTRDLVTVLVFTIFLVFTTGLKRALGRGAGLAGEIACTSGLVYAAMTLVSASLETGVVLEYPDGSKDPTIDGPLANGMVLLHGPIARLLLATFFLALAVAVHRTNSLPRRIGTGSVLLAAVNLAFVPSLFFGMDPANFYAANGWGSTASIGMVNMLWTGAIGAAVLRRGAAPRPELSQREEVPALGDHR